MTAHYRNGDFPPWVTATATVGVGGGSAQLSPNNSPTESSYPKVKHENMTQFGLYGNLPTVSYSNVTGITGPANYHTADTIPPTPVAQSFSPQSPHSQYSSTTGSFEPYNATPVVRHSIIYAPFAGAPTRDGPPSTLTHGTPGPVSSQLLANNSPTQSSYPKTNHENPTQFGMHGNLPTVPYPNATGVTGYTAVHYHTANTIPPIPVTQAFSPQSQYSQYPGTTGSVKPHNETPNVHHSILYAPFAASSTQIGPPVPPKDGAPATHSRTLANRVTYNPSPRGPEYAEASVSAQAPEHAEASVSAQAPVYLGGTYNANANPKGKDHENTVLPTGNPKKTISEGLSTIFTKRLLNVGGSRIG